MCKKIIINSVLVGVMLFMTGYILLSHKNIAICDSKIQISRMINASTSKLVFRDQIFTELDVTLSGDFIETFVGRNPFAFVDVRWVDRGTEKRLLMMPYSFRGKNRYGVAVFLNQNSIPDDMNLLTDIIRDKNTCSNIIYLESNYEGIPAFCEIDRAGMLMKTPSSHWGIIIAVEKNKGIILWNGCYKLNFPQKQVFRKFEIQQCNDFVGGDVLVWPDLSNVNIQMLKEHNYKNEIMVTH